MANEEIKEGFFIQGKDNKSIYLHCWENVKNPRAVIQIFHGMAEHGGRYKQFAEYLNKKGYAVYADDHRGHGKTAGSKEEYGYIGEDGFNKIVEDEYIIKDYIQKKHKGLPIIIFGHSFGSFIAQEFILRYGSELAGVILCGSAARSGPEIVAGRLVSYIEKSLFGEKKKSKLLDFLTFRSYNKHFKNSQSKSWLCSNEEAVIKYAEDPFCGGLVTASFYHELFKGISKLYKNERLSNIPKHLPIYIIAGEDDPVGNFGVLVKKLYNKYLNIGMSNIELKLYKKCRHELLNEVNKDEIYSEIIKWISDIKL